MISDAGTPTISDPGYELVTAVQMNRSALFPFQDAVKPLQTYAFQNLLRTHFFYRIFTQKAGKAGQALENAKEQSATLIFYKFLRRGKTLISNMLNIFEDKKPCLAKRITKLHEEYIRGNLSDVLKRLEKKETLNG